MKTWLFQSKTTEDRIRNCELKFYLTKLNLASSKKCSWQDCCEKLELDIRSTPWKRNDCYYWSLNHDYILKVDNVCCQVHTMWNRLKIKRVEFKIFRGILIRKFLQRTIVNKPRFLIYFSKTNSMCLNTNITTSSLISYYLLHEQFCL